MARHSRSRSRSRSSHKRRKHSHRSERARSRERSSSTKESVSERSRESREERRGRDKDRHREEREHKRTKHSRVDSEREEAFDRGSESTSDRHYHHHHHNGRSSTTTISTISNNQETREIKGSSKSSSHITTFNVTDNKTENIGVRDSSLTPNGHGKQSKSQSPEPKALNATSPKTIVSLIDQEEEEKIPEEEAKAKIAAESTSSSTNQDIHQDIRNNGKGWSLDDDDEDDTMDVDGVTETVVDLPLPIPKVADKSTEPSSTLQFRRNPLLGLGNKKSTINIKTKSKATASTEDEDKGLTSSSPSKLNNAKEATMSSTNTTQIVETANEDEDPLDAYMKDVEIKVGILNEQDKKIAKQIDKDILAIAAKKLKKKDLAAVDHSQVKYEPFQKNFYIEPPEMRDLTPDQVDLLRVELDGIKIRGIDCPKPIKKWTHAGLPASCLQVIKKLNFEKPTPIQSQAIPAIMAGRDVIGVAKTGSGKTIAFLLPMFRHIKDQRPLEPMEGPISIIMTPTRELAAVCAYGGSPIKDQIADLKRGAEIIVCTPGRMIDLLCANAGRVTNLKRVTYLVLDEADRMFDMGFEPQVMKIVNNVRPDRQTVLFSATFPRQMESLARKVLRKPLEITVGGRSVVAQDVTQLVEVREENTKFVRLLEILGQQYNDDPDARCLIFVDRQEAADNLLRDLIRKGYPCMSLHGGKDQLDRDSTIADFKSGVCQLLIATSVAARGLDVKQLKLVINYECPNHMEDYVHRVGRTGRAGNKGTAYTFITPEQDRYAMDIMKALKLSGGNVTPELQQLAEGFQEKVKAGSATYSGSGFGGKGLERLDEARDLVKKAQRKTYEEISSAASIAAAAVSSKISSLAASTPAAASSIASVTSSVSGQSTEMNPAAIAALKAAQQAAARINAAVGTSGVQRAKDIIADINSRFKENSVQGGVVTEENKTENAAEYSVEIEINDYPQKARWKVTNKEQISQITELTGAAITTRGTYFPPGRNPAPGSGERKLYLFVEGENEYVVEKAKNEIKRILTETTLSAIEAESRNPGSNSLGGYGKYTVV
ncbi:6864_t:CDS:10 [Ambispora leptoticha]|uniref:RNA helicase n=1 Tax=Ambispora leptoticha TaxID=144679 RepID=A0A9N8VC56_9GLOM|nr:6864_t:CDS:10 [Ambispora leptoticha]